MPGWTIADKSVEGQNEDGSYRAVVMVKCGCERSDVVAK